MSLSEEILKKVRALTGNPKFQGRLAVPLHEDCVIGYGLAEEAPDVSSTPIQPEINAGVRVTLVPDAVVPELVWVTINQGPGVVLYTWQRDAKTRHVVTEGVDSKNQVELDAFRSQQNAQQEAWRLVQLTGVDNVPLMLRLIKYRERNDVILAFDLAAWLLARAGNDIPSAQADARELANTTNLQRKEALRGHRAGGLRGKGLAMAVQGALQILNMA